MEEQKGDIREEDLKVLISLIKEGYGYDFSDYSQVSFSRRVLRFLSEMKYENVQQAITEIEKDKKVFRAFLEKITVNVTEMFRDPEFYRSLKDEVIPRLSSYPIIKIWDVGCSSGEEVYSIAILLHEAGLLQRTRIYATDLNPANLEKAKKGIMPLQVMKDYTTNYIKAGGTNDFATYYTAKYSNAIIKKEFRDRVVFTEHNLVTDQAFNEFQFICCRNVMIYFNRELQDRVVHLFYSSLSPLGYLALGIKESLLFTTLRPQFEVINARTKIFRRKS
jgi:chemotaxis protein methyltransferase CheR